MKINPKQKNAPAPPWENTSGPAAMPIAELEARLRIDEHSLDAALLEQPDAFYRVSKALAYAISRRDAAKKQLAEAEAKADARIRLEAARAGERTKEAEIGSEKLLDKGVQTVAENLHKLSLNVGRLSALKEAFQQRSYVLKDLVQLHLANYFGDVTPKAVEGELRDRQAEFARQKLNEARRSGAYDRRS